MELWQISAVGLGRLVAEGWASSRQIVQAHLDRVAAVDSSVNAVAEMRADHALAEAEEAARAVRARGRRSALRGVPFMVRRTSDLARTPGIPVQAPPSPRPLAPVDRLRGLGAVPIGRTTTADWAFHRGAAGTKIRATVNP